MSDDDEILLEEAKRRWGGTDAYRQSVERVEKMTREEVSVLKESGKKLAQELADAMDCAVESLRAQALVQKHYDSICVFYDCPVVLYRNLGAMYVDDSRFTTYYDAFRPGLAVWLRDAIEVFCDGKEFGQKM